MAYGQSDRMGYTDNAVVRQVRFANTAREFFDTEYLNWWKILRKQIDLYYGKYY